MSRADREPEARSDKAAWLVPAVISAVVSIVAIVQSCVVAQSAQKSEQAVEVSKVKLQIIQSINTFDFPTARVLLVHVLKPVDSRQGYEKFQREFLELVAKRAPEAQPSEVADAQKVTAELTIVGAPLTIPGGDEGVSVFTEKFRGSERLTASNELIELYNRKPADVVQGILNALLPDGDKDAYRVNLYAVFTLARIEPKWEGTPEQLERIKGLRNSRYYRDGTFRRRVEEAISNWAPRNG